MATPTNEGRIDTTTLRRRNLLDYFLIFLKIPVKI